MTTQTLSDVSQAWKNGTLGNTGDVYKRTPTAIWAKNIGTDVAANRPVEIVGFSSTFTFEKAYQKMIAGDLALAVSSTITTGEVVITASPIESMKFGQVEGEVLFGVVQFGNTSDEYADSSFTSSSDPSTFRIVATSGLASSGATRAVCALVKLSGEGGGEVEVKTPLWKDDEIICAGLLVMNEDNTPVIPQTGQDSVSTNTGLSANTSVLVAREGLKFERLNPDQGGMCKDGWQVGLSVDLSSELQKESFVQTITPTYDSASVCGSPTMANVVSGITPETSTGVTAVTAETTAFVSEVDTETSTAVTEVTSEDATVVGSVDSETDKAITSVTPTEGTFVTEVSTEDSTFVTEVTPTNGTFVTEVSTTDGDFVTDVSTTPGTFVTGVDSSTGQAVTSVTFTNSNVITKLKPITGQVIREVKSVGGQAVGSITPQTDSFVKTLTTAQKTVVTAVSLVESSAAQGGFQVVTGVSCVNGQIVVTTGYIGLQVTTEVVNVVASSLTGQAMIGVTPTPTPIVSSVQGVPTFAVVKLEQESANAATNIQAPTASVVQSITPQTGSGIATATPQKGKALVSATGTTATAVASISSSTSSALTSATGTTGTAVASIETEDGDFVTEVTSEDATVVGSVDSETSDFVTTVTPTTENGVSSVTPTTGNVVTGVTPTYKRVVETVTSSTISFITSITPTTAEAVTDIQ